MLRIANAHLLAELVARADDLLWVYRGVEALRIVLTCSYRNIRSRLC